MNRATTRETLNLNHSSSTPPVAGARPPRRPVQVIRRLKDDVCFSQESAARGEDDSAQSLCSNFMAAWG